MPLQRSTSVRYRLHKLYMSTVYGSHYSIRRFHTACAVWLTEDISNYYLQSYRVSQHVCSESRSVE